MNEITKISTPKTCPLYGAHFMRIETRVKEIQIGTQQATIPNLVSCNGNGCQWWSEAQNDCTVAVFTREAYLIRLSMQELKETLERITNLLYDKGGK
jgi:hypothetical protein